MRDHECRAARHHLRQRGADLVLLRRVDRRGRVVEDQHLRVGEDGARDRDSLPLAAREREAALAEHRLVALRQALDELRGAGEPGGRRISSSSASGIAKPTLPLTVSPKRNVSSNTSPTPRRSSLEPKLAHVDAADRHAAAVRVVEAREQRGDRRLAGAGRADERERLAFRDRRATARRGSGARRRRRSGRPRSGRRSARGKPRGEAPRRRRAAASSTSTTRRAAAAPRCTVLTRCPIVRSGKTSSTR